MSQGIHFRKYGVQTVINFELYEVDGVDLRVDAVDAGSDCNIMKDQGAEATCSNDFVDEGNGYSLTITATEMQAATVTLYIIDSATKAWLDKVIHIDTYGNASAEHAMDFDDSVRAGLTALPNAAADAAGGLVISDAGGFDIDAIQQVAASGVVETSGSNSSTQVQTDLAEATNDHYDVMTILFTSGAEAGQSRLITGYVGSTGVVSWNAALTGTPADDVTFDIVAAGTTADAVWDEILTGSSHNISTSAGKRLRQLEEAFVQAEGTIATVTNGHTITLDAGAVATTDYYPHSRLTIVEGTGAGQSRLIINYTSGRVCTLESDFTTNPDTNSLYTVEAADANVAGDSSDLAQGFVATYTNTTTITLDSGAIATTDFHKETIISFTSGTGAGQEREISAYTSGRVCTLTPALTTALDTTTTYRIIPSVSAAHISDEVWDEAQADHVAAGSFGIIASEIASILTDTGTDGVVVASINTDAVDAVAFNTNVWAELLDLANGVESGITLRQYMRVALAALAGKADGLATTTAHYRDQADGTNRITATVDADGNRTAITLDTS